jgi:3-deoxy-7-phosphoheptulonate synthase
MRGLIHRLPCKSDHTEQSMKKSADLLNGDPDLNTDDLRICKIEEVAAPVQVHEDYPISQAAALTTLRARQGIHRILSGDDDRLLVIIGPCSIHDPAAAVEYAERLLRLKSELSRDLLVAMRVYFEKPRTTVGWKGLINDPDLNESFNINKGLRIARKLLLDLNQMGMPAATEYLDLITPQYVSDLICWGAIGARTTESQVHRELASGLSCPVGFKNGTDGGFKVAIDAISAARRPHHFLSVTKAGHSAIFSTSGNEDTHVILRGGKTPNFDAGSVESAARALEMAGLKPNLMVDFSHANSMKDYRKQLFAGRDVASQIAGGDNRIIGVMVESHLTEGQQKLSDGKPLVYGQSITDACLGWQDSEALLRELASAVERRRSNRFGEDDVPSAKIRNA